MEGTPSRARVAIGAVLALAVVVAVHLHRLDRPLLWGDEADTGIGARSVLRIGYPAAFDGRNVTLALFGWQLNRELTFKSVPWVPYYVGAASIAVFGDDTGGLRVLFAVAGILAFFPLRALLKPHVAQPSYLAALALSCPQVLLLDRSARYYSQLVLVFALLVWVMSVRPSRWTPALTAALLAVLFHVHPIAACATAASLVLYGFLAQPERRREYAAGAALAFLAWFAWYRALGPSLADNPARFPILMLTPWMRWRGVTHSLFCTLLDVDAVGCFPSLVWIALAGHLLLARRDQLAQLARQPVFGFVLLNFAVHSLAIACTLGWEKLSLSFLRYMPHLLAMLPVALFVGLAVVVGRAWWHAAACTALIGFNVFGLAYWSAPLNCDVPVSWYPPVYSEIHAPQRTLWDALITFFQELPPAAGDPEQVLTFAPSLSPEIPIFYLGRRYLVHPILSGSNEASIRAIYRVLGRKVVEQLERPAEWIVDTDVTSNAAWAGYAPAGTVTTRHGAHNDGARPELTRHRWPDGEPEPALRIWRRVEGR